MSKPHAEKGDCQLICNASFQQRLERYAASALLALFGFIIGAHLIFFCQKESCGRVFDVLWSRAGRFQSQVPDEFPNAVISGLVIWLLSFAVVYHNSEIPGVDPDLPWHRGGRSMNISYGMTFVVGALTFAFGLTPNLFTWVHSR
ncbi:uncharacterized protein ISCGN_013219 [Ixodes scapularis]